MPSENDHIEEIPMRFSDVYSRADFAAYKASLNSGGGGPFDRQKHMSEVFLPAMRKLLVHLREEGRLAPIQGLRNHDVRHATAWNAFVAGTTGQRNHRENAMIVAFFGINVDPMTSPMIPKGEKPDPYEETCRLIDSGTSETWNRIDFAMDIATGEYVHFHFEDWKPIVGVLDGRCKHRIRPLEDMDPDPLATIEVDMPTGELIICDGFGFRSGVELEDDIGYTSDVDISSERGKVGASKAYAAKHGYLYVAVDNMSKSLFKDADDRIVIADRMLPDSDADLEDIAGFDRLPNTCSDVWGVNVIDKAVLIANLTRQGVKKAAAFLERELAADAGPKGVKRFVQVKVAPGRYRMHVGHDFTNRFNRISAGIPAEPRLWAFIERA
jgi:hypothetical protein